MNKLNCLKGIFLIRTKLFIFIILFKPYVNEAVVNEHDDELFL